MTYMGTNVKVVKVELEYETWTCGEGCCFDGWYNLTEYGENGKVVSSYDEYDRNFDTAVERIKEDHGDDIEIVGEDYWA